MPYTSVEYQDEEYPRLVFFSPPTEETPYQQMHEIPLQAIADRMELFGLESVEQTLEYLGLEAGKPEISDTLHEPIQQAYGAVAQSEYAQTLMPNPRPSQDQTPQTLMNPMQIADHKRETLALRRTEALQKLGMQSIAHSEPAARMLDPTRPAQRTQAAAAQALGADEAVIAQAVQLVQDHPDHVEAWRVETLVSYVTPMRRHLAQQARQARQARAQ